MEAPNPRTVQLLETGKTGILRMSQRRWQRWKQAEVRLLPAKNSPGCTRAGEGKERYLQGSAAHSQKQERKISQETSKKQDPSSMSKPQELGQDCCQGNRYQGRPRPSRKEPAGHAGHPVAEVLCKKDCFSSKNSCKGLTRRPGG